MKIDLPDAYFSCLENSQHPLYNTDDKSNIATESHGSLCSVYGEMADRVRYLKESSEGVSQMCKIMEDMRDEARAEGVSEGEKNKGIKIAIKMIADNESDAKIRDYTDLSLEDIQALRRGQTVTA